MPRLTRLEIERALLNGTAVSWTDAAGKPATIRLAAAKERRLLAYLLSSTTRDPRGLPPEFIDGLSAAFAAAGDPAAANVQQTVNPSVSGPWKIHALEIQGFGGVNTWNGEPFKLALDQESLLIDGPNGSGKSSLIGAIIWALTGERPRDQGDGSLAGAKPVFDREGKTAGAWPPVASYPPELKFLQTQPNVMVEVVFSNTSGTLASVCRRFDGKKITYNVDPALQIPTVLVEAGILMPARMPHLRLDEGAGRLTEAVQKLTGLDELIEIGTFAQGLCNGGREYLTYQKAELASLEAEFHRQIERARTALSPVGLAVPSFKPTDTDQKEGVMAKLGKLLNDKAAELVGTVASDLGPGLLLTDPKVQQQIIVALDGAEKDLAAGISALSSLRSIEDLAVAFAEETRTNARSAITAAEDALSVALEYYEKQQNDTKFRLKAAGAHWHNENVDGPIEACPLCEVSLSSNLILREELSALRLAGEAATRRLSDNLNAIMASLADCVPRNLRRLLDGDVPSQPRADIEREYRSRFVEAERYSTYLVKFGAAAEAAIALMPQDDLVNAPTRAVALPATAGVIERLNKIERMCRLAEWWEAQGQKWHGWWAMLSSRADSPDESLFSCLTRLGKSLREAEPYRIGADAMRMSWVAGRGSTAIIREQERRREIADCLAPLKQLGNLAEAQARNAINDLSGRIAAIHSATYVVDRLAFEGAALDRKTGLIVHGQLGKDLRIDATLIANTSWLRSVLWAFIHALREEAVEQIGGDIFPVMLLDDPQQTFDSEHRARWAEQIAKIQKASPGVQILLATHDDQFLSLLDFLDITGRRANICSAGDELGHIAILEGAQLERSWVAANVARTPTAAKAHIAAVREFAEGTLRLMLRGIDPTIPKAVLGACREKISELHEKAIEPWNRPAFSTLIAALAKARKEIKFMEEAHHSSMIFSMNDAADVEAHWEKTLRPALERGFRIVCDHRALHGGLTALHAFPPFVNLPEGHRAKVGEFKLPFLGTAAALTDGRVADGLIDLTLDSGLASAVELKDHSVFRLLAPTLDPVAQQGDLLLIRDHAEAAPLSLVVALHENEILARRLQVADNHNDVAVLTASSTNPLLIAAPIVAKLSTLTLKKIVGVLYEKGKGFSPQSTDIEVGECGGESAIAAVLSRAKGLVKVSGHSAVPRALDKQFLIIGGAVPLKEAEKSLEGRPVIAEDSDGDRYFKRLRVEANHVILESLEISGDFPPILIAKPGNGPRYIVQTWPVLGVLFELL